MALFSEEFYQWKYQNIRQHDKFVSIRLWYLRNDDDIWQALTQVNYCLPFLQKGYKIWRLMKN